MSITDRYCSRRLFVTKKQQSKSKKFGDMVSGLLKQPFLGHASAAIQAFIRRAITSRGDTSR